MSKTATETIRELEAINRLAHPLDKLLYRLRRFMGAYPVDEDAKVPEMKMIWLDQISTGPKNVILDAIKSHPDLWMHAVPPEVCMVPRSALKKIGISDGVIDVLNDMGRNMVDTQAARYDHLLNHHKGI